jgi:NAD(P)H-hydrate epimerase
MGARGALRAGAGLVTVVGSVTATAVNATHLTAVMIKGVGGDAALAEFLSDVRRNAALIGPGASVGAGTSADVGALTSCALLSRRLGLWPEYCVSEAFLHGCRPSQ